MEPGERETTFEEVDRRYAELKRRHEDGALNDEEFKARLTEQMVRDEEGRWWAKSPRTGAWHYHDGEIWIRGTPPVGDQNQGEQHWDRRRWMVLGAAFAVPVVVVVAVVALITFVENGPSTGQPRVVLRDDFSKSSTGWTQTKKDLYGNYSEKGRYRMYIMGGEAGHIRWSMLSDAQVPDEGAIVEVDATRAGDSPSNTNSNWGIVCPASESGKYLMGISDAGYPIIQRVKKDGSFSTLAKKPSYEGHAIQKDGATNHIRGDCIGSKLTLYVNDAEVLKVDDSKVGISDQVGLYVHDAGYKPPGTDVFFDNFSVSVP